MPENVETQLSKQDLADGIAYLLEPGRLSAAMQAARASSEHYSREQFEQSWTTVFARSAS